MISEAKGRETIIPRISEVGRIKIRVNDTHLFVYYPPQRPAELPDSRIMEERADNIGNLLISAFGRVEAYSIEHRNDHTLITLQCAHPAWGNGSVPFCFRRRDSDEARALDTEWADPLPPQI